MCAQLLARAKSDGVPIDWVQASCPLQDVCLHTPPPDDKYRPSQWNAFAIMDASPFGCVNTRCKCMREHVSGAGAHTLPPDIPTNSHCVCHMLMLPTRPMLPCRSVGMPLQPAAAGEQHGAAHKPRGAHRSPAHAREGAGADGWLHRCGDGEAGSADPALRRRVRPGNASFGCLGGSGTSSAAHCLLSHLPWREGFLVCCACCAVTSAGGAAQTTRCSAPSASPGRCCWTTPE